MPAPAGEEDSGLAASPWHTANNPGLNRDLLPSAMLAPAPPRETASKPPARPEPAAEAPSRAPWIIVGVLAIVAVAGAILVVQLSKKNKGSGQIAIPAGQTTADDSPTDTAPSASASASAAPTVRGPIKPKTYLDDPYADNPAPVRPKAAPTPSSNPAPTAAPTAAPHRLFGTEN